MSDKIKLEDKPKTEQEQANEFIKAYSELCEKYQFQIVVTPTYIARDDGTFSTKLISSVGRLPKKV